MPLPTTPTSSGGSASPSTDSPPTSGSLGTSNSTTSAVQSGPPRSAPMPIRSTGRSAANGSASAASSFGSPFAPYASSIGSAPGGAAVELKRADGASVTASSAITGNFDAGVANRVSSLATGVPAAADPHALHPANEAAIAALTNGADLSASIDITSDAIQSAPTSTRCPSLHETPARLTFLAMAALSSAGMIALNATDEDLNNRYGIAASGLAAGISLRLFLRSMANDEDLSDEPYQALPDDGADDEKANNEIRVQNPATWENIFDHIVQNHPYPIILIQLILIDFFCSGYYTRLAWLVMYSMGSFLSGFNITSRAFYWLSKFFGASNETTVAVSTNATVSTPAIFDISVTSFSVRERFTASFITRTLFETLGGIGLIFAGKLYFDALILPDLITPIKDFGIWLTSFGLTKFGEILFIPRADSIRVLMISLSSSLVSIGASSSLTVSGSVRLAVGGVIVSINTSLVDEQIRVRRIRIGKDIERITQWNSANPEFGPAIKALAEQFNLQTTMRAHANIDNRPVNFWVKIGTAGGLVTIGLLSFLVDNPTGALNTTTFIFTLSTYGLVKKIQVQPLEDYQRQNDQSWGYWFRSTLSHYLQENTLWTAAAYTYLVNIWNTLIYNYKDFDLAPIGILGGLFAIAALQWGTALAYPYAKPYLESNEIKAIDRSVRLADDRLSIHPETLLYIAERLPDKTIANVSVAFCRRVFLISSGVNFGNAPNSSAFGGGPAHDAVQALEQNGGHFITPAP